MVNENTWLNEMSLGGVGLRGYYLTRYVPEHIEIILSWRRLTRAGGGRIANGVLSPFGARNLWNNNWEAEDIIDRDGDLWNYSSQWNNWLCLRCC